MNIFDDQKLTNTLFKLEYPLPDYQLFAISWPHSSAEIEQLHKNLKASKIDINAFKNMGQAVRAFGCSATEAEKEFRKFGERLKKLK